MCILTRDARHVPRTEAIMRIIRRITKCALHEETVLCAIDQTRKACLLLNSFDGYVSRVLQRSYKDTARLFTVQHIRFVCYASDAFAASEDLLSS